MNKPVDPNRKTAFAVPGALPGTLSAATAASLLAAVGDVTFILSAEGVILDLAVTQSDLAYQGFADWIGSPFIDTVTVESRPKVVEMLAASRAKSSSARWRQVNHPAPGGEVPVRYLLMGLGTEDRLVAIGRDMRGAAAMQKRLLETQQSLERDYIRLRQAETRYRMLFDLASDPVLIVDAQTRRIREANPAAYQLLAAAEGTLTGSPVVSIVDEAHRDDFVAHLGAAEAADDIAPATLRLGHGRGDAHVSARLFRQARAALMIVRIMPADGAPGHQYDSTLSDVVERMPDAFVLVDRGLNVLTANAAFVELTELPSVERVVGARLSEWVGRPGIDLELIVGQLREHGSVRNVASILRGSAGAQEEIEVSGVVAPMDNGECFGFTIRTVGRRPREAAIIARDMPRSVEQLTDLVGRMSLKEIVRELTDLVERLCIEAALAYTSDNRASAAEILGVSRQSLYSKLHRHGLGNLNSSED